MKKGDIVRLVHYARVEKVSDADYVEIKDLDRGIEFNVVGKPLVDSLDSADDYSTESIVSRSKIVELFEGAGDNVFTVEFIKADGTLRTLRGRMIERETGFGRSQVADLDLPNPYNLRQVDHRTLNVLILDGVKYTKG